MWLYISLSIDSVTGQTVSAKKRKKGHCDTHHSAERAEGHKGQSTKCHEPEFSDGPDWVCVCSWFRHVPAVSSSTSLMLE